MFVVKIANNSGKTVNWDYFPTRAQAERERELLHDEHDFWYDDIFIDEI